MCRGIPIVRGVTCVSQLPLLRRVICVVISFCAMCHTALGGLSLADIIANVESAEILYRDVSVEFTSQYQITEYKRQNMYSQREVNSIDEKCNQTSVGEKYRLEVDGETRSRVEVSNRDRISAYDGVSMKIFEQNAVGNIGPKRRLDKHLFRPHVLAYYNHDPLEPLSIRLRGDEAYFLYTGKRRAYTIDKCEYIGEEIREGIRCHRIDFIYPKTENPVNESKASLWIAESRNYLPVAYETYIHTDKGDLAFCQSVVESFHEITTGVWVPKKVVIRLFDQFALAETGELHELWNQVITVNSCQLISEADPKLFSEVEFPDGTAMYELDAAGKILKSWRVGQVQEPAGPVPTVWWSRNTVLLVVALLTVGTAVYFIMRRRSLVPLER